MPESQSNILTGDLDQDGVVTMDDTFIVLQYYSKHAAGSMHYTFCEDEALEKKLEDAADIDGDGSITMDDAFLILQYYSYHAAGRNITWSEMIK